MKSSFIIQGFLKGTRQHGKTVECAHNLESTFEGFKLDELQIQAVITDRTDIEHLIKFLTVSMHCFL